MDLLKMLTNEKNLLIEMLETLKLEKQILINDDINGLKEVTEKKGKLASSIDNCEKARIAQYGNATLKELTLKLDGKKSEEAEALGRDIKSAVYEIQQLNDLNCQLMKQSLNYIRAVMNLVSPPKVSVYNSSGNVNNKPSASGMLDRNI